MGDETFQPEEGGGGGGEEQGGGRCFLPEILFKKLSLVVAPHHKSTYNHRHREASSEARPELYKY